MRCPLLQVNQVWDEGERGKEKDRCLQDECAWYMNGDSICAIPAIAANLSEIEEDLTRVADNIKAGWSK